jgi:hypothetical protein
MNNMNQAAIILTLFLQLVVAASEAQIIKGIVVDAASKEPLPYVHIGIFHKNMGVISRDNGTFEINVEKALPQEALTFSMIGYETKSIKIQEIGTRYIEVKLNPKIYVLKEVVVNESHISNPLKLGRFQPTKTTTGHSGVGNFGFGGEWGIRIFNDEKVYRIKDVNFHLRFNTLDSILFRINMYSIKENLPYESVLSEEIFVKSYKRDKWITKNLEAESLIIDQDIIVSFEVVQLWYSATGNNHFFYTHGEGYDQSLTYFRASSLAQWVIQEHFPITLFLTVEGN